MVCDTLPSLDESTHQIWNSFLKECKRYALDTIIPKTRSEVKVTVTIKWYVTLHQPKVHLHTKFGIPISKNIEDMHQTQPRSEVKFTVTETQLWSATLCHRKLHLHTKFKIPTSNNMRYALDTIILKTRSGVKVTMTCKWYMTLCHPKMHFHTKVVNPI